MEKEEILKNSKNELELITKDLFSKEKEKSKWENKVGELKRKNEKIVSELKECTQKNSNFEVDKIKISGENEDLEKRILSAKSENKRLSTDYDKLADSNRVRYLEIMAQIHL